MSDPLSQITWATGPQQIHLGDYADMDVPAGYQMTDARGARILLESLNNPVPADTIGLITPASGSAKWWAVIEYDSKGYIKNPEAGKLNAAAVLKTVQARIKGQNSGVTALNWQSAPVYDPQMHSLAWSLEIQAGSMKALNETVALLSRNGVLQITAYQPYPVSDVAPLKQLAAGITFKDGNRYADYQAGDKVADIGLAELIAGGKPSRASSFVSSGTVMIVIYSGFAVCIVVGVVALLRKKSRRHTAKVSGRESSRRRSSGRRPAIIAIPATAVPVSAASATAPAPVAAVAPTTAPVAPVTAAPSATTIQQNTMAPAQPSPNGNNNAKHMHRNRRKKFFNYPKFYTTVMRELSLHSYGPASGTNGKLNGHHGRHVNGNSHNEHVNGSSSHTNGHATTPPAPAAGDSLKAEIIELIATQKNLINEQKCLLDQQTKLIEEKRWLIEEQTAFLKNQTGQQYP